jgi:hypothetical protein
MRSLARIAAFSLLVLFGGAVLAQRAQPLAPGQAKVIGIRTINTYSESSDVSTDSTGNVHGSGSGATKIRQVYKLETANSFIEVTGWENVFKAHSRPAMQIGDVVSYELDKKHGQYVMLLLNDGKKDKWHKFLRVGAEAK